MVYRAVSRLCWHVFSRKGQDRVEAEAEQSRVEQSRVEAVGSCKIKKIKKKLKLKIHFLVGFLGVWGVEDLILAR